MLSDFIVDRGDDEDDPTKLYCICKNLYHPGEFMIGKYIILIYLIEN